MATILANPVEICFGSFMAASSALTATTSPMAAGQVATASYATHISDLTTETHPLKPYDIVQGIECVICMIKDTLQICEQVQRSMQMALRHGTYPFGFRPPTDVYT
jgi:hypothetical protein